MLSPLMIKAKVPGLTKEGNLPDRKSSFIASTDRKSSFMVPQDPNDMQKINLFPGNSEKNVKISTPRTYFFIRLKKQFGIIDDSR